MIKRFLFALLLPVSFWQCTEKPVIVRGVSIDSSPEFVGDSKCAECHQQEYDSWEDSHHFRSMQLAADSTVLGNFDNTLFESKGVKTQFTRDGESFFVETEGIGGKRQKFEILYTFGFDPLQQYLVDIGSGKLQALHYAWDTEKRQWFDLYPSDTIIPQDWLHWTKGGLNWNTMCAECHSTNYTKNYNDDNDDYNSSFSLINVSCESCHGSGEKHVSWANNPGDDPNPYISLVSNTAQAEQIRSCMPCHSRKVNLSEKLTFQGNTLDDFVPEVLVEGLYHKDGQIDDEVYVYGSFLQSKMHGEGVRCTDCHDAHSLKLKAEGNNLCLQCHEPSYSSSEHSFHGAEISCIDCHMTGKYYMQVDFRRDHSFRIPRPDQSLMHGTPNACTECHEDKSDDWAASAIENWYGTERTNHFSDLLTVGSEQNIESIPFLTELLLNTEEPEIARATAAVYLSRIPAEEAVEVLINALYDSSALVRYYALRGFYGQYPQLRLEAAAPLLTDDLKAVRIAAAEVLSGIDPNNIPFELQGSYFSAESEYRRSLEARSDFPMGQFALGQYYYQKGEIDSSRIHFERALKMDTLLHPARENLARIYNRQGNNDLALQQLDIILSFEPDNIDALYSASLIYAEGDQLDSTIRLLQKVTDLEPGYERAWYNLSIALTQLGKIKESEETMLSAIEQIPETVLIRQLLAIHYIQNGDAASAQELVSYLKAQFPGNEEIENLQNAINQIQ